MKNRELLERTAWLIRLRWLACAGLFVIPFAVPLIFRIPLELPPVIIVAVFIGAYNLAFSLLVRKISAAAPEKTEGMTVTIDNVQIGLDLICLTVLVHFTGGVENPFIFYFIFHIIISSILLSRANAFWQANLAAVLFLGMSGLEYTGKIAHHALPGFMPHPLYNVPVFFAGIVFVFISTLYISLYLASSIMRRLREREKNLEEANRLLEENDRIKSEYVLRVSHDIKGHIAAIQTCIDPVRTEITGPLSGAQKNLLNRADERSRKLLAFVKTLLNLTIMKLKDSDDIAVLDLTAMAGEAVNFVRPAAKSKDITLEYAHEGPPFRLRVSKSEMNATLIEMISNAVRYTPAGGNVKISAGMKNGEYTIGISDTGIGIPAKDQPKIFAEFYRASNAKLADSSSSGLGLAMAKHVVEKAGGEISVVSEEGKGSTFSIKFPATGGEQG